ncbi:hypothetical protein FACS189429_6280 [Bacteroidia bacterium]|nr:hypothetical protein FACS189429_6280 [Bacteroidia bacterium]
MKKHLSKHCNKLFVTLFVLLCPFIAFGQTKISGNIRNEKGENVQNVLVSLLKSEDNSILAYNFTDEKGNFSLLYSGNDKDFSVKVSGLNVVEQMKKLQNVSQTVNFTIAEKEITLKEVIIKSPKITYNKDTINYSVSQFINDKDMVIGDVLKKMPGIAVEESGEIKYNGQSINRFYIENLDMLHGRKF